MSMIHLASIIVVFLVISMPTELNCRSLKMAESESEFSSKSFEIKPIIVEEKNSQKVNSGESLKNIMVKIEPSIVSSSSNIKLEPNVMSLKHGTKRIISSLHNVDNTAGKLNGYPEELDSKIKVANDKLKDEILLETERIEDELDALTKLHHSDIETIEKKIQMLSEKIDVSSSSSSNNKLESSAMSLESFQDSSVSLQKIPVIIKDKNSSEEKVFFKKGILKSQDRFFIEKPVKIEEKEPVVIDSLSKKIKIESSKILDSEEAKKVEVPFKVVDKKVPENVIFEKRIIKSKRGEFIEKPFKVEEKKPMVIDSKVLVLSKEAKKVEVPLIKEVNKPQEDKLVFLRRGIVGKIDFGKKDFGLKKDFSKFDFDKKKLVG